MKIEVLKLSDEKGRFLLRETSSAFVNAIRRSAMADVQKMAVDYINVYDNTSSLYDEILASRIGLIPLTADLNSLKLPEECWCGGEGCPSCQVSLTLTAEGPKMVYSRDLFSTDPSIQPSFPDIPIVKLVDGQRVMIEAVARLGKGKKHAKWQPTVACGYKNMPKITIKDCDKCGRCIDECPKQLLSLNKELKVKDLMECSLCGLCEKACALGAIEVGVEEDAFIFVVESDGSMPVAEIMIRSAEELGKKVLELKEDLESIQKDAGVAEIGQRRRT